MTQSGIPTSWIETLYAGSNIDDNLKIEMRIYTVPFIILEDFIFTVSLAFLGEERIGMTVFQAYTLFLTN